MSGIIDGEPLVDHSTREKHLQTKLSAADHRNIPGLDQTKTGRFAFQEIMDCNPEVMGDFGE